VRLSLWDANPAEPKEAHELVSNDEGMPCATLHWQIPKAMSVYLVVEGAAAGEEGIFELLVLCKELPSETEDAVCANDFITCGDVKDATTVGFDNFVGSTSGDRFFLVTAFEATDITATTCGAITSFPTVISLYDGYPTNSTLMGKSDPSAPCGMLFATLPAAGAYYLVVDGVADTDEGVFSLTLLCAEKEAKPLEDSCSLQFLTCGDVVTVSQAASIGHYLATTSLPAMRPAPSDHRLATTSPRHFRVPISGTRTSLAPRVATPCTPSRCLSPYALLLRHATASPHFSLSCTYSMAFRT
jgi:hypothetical protein